MKITFVIDNAVDLELAQKAFVGEVEQQKWHALISTLSADLENEKAARADSEARFRVDKARMEEDVKGYSRAMADLLKEMAQMEEKYLALTSGKEELRIEYLEQDLVKRTQSMRQNAQSASDEETRGKEMCNAENKTASQDAFLPHNTAEKLLGEVVEGLREELANAVAENQKLAQDKESLREALAQTGQACAEQEQRIEYLEQDLTALKNAAKPQRTRKPKADAPVVDAPVVDAPVVDAPVVDAPVVDAPVVDAPVVDAPVVDAPVGDAPVVDVPVVEEDEADVLFPGNADAPFQAGHYSKLLSKFKDLASKKPMLYHVHLKARVLQAAGIEDSGALIMQQITTFGAARLAWRELCKMEEEERGA